MIKLNEYIIYPTVFPDGTSQVWKIPEEVFASQYGAQIEWFFNHESEFMELAQLKHLLDSRNDLPTTLVIDYLPYGRQDKAVSNDATFGLHTFAKLLNSLEFYEVYINDPHSSKFKSLINRSKAFYPTHQVNNVFSNVGADVVCYPDKGAHTKYDKIYRKPFVYGSKERNQSTGELGDWILEGKVLGKNVLIVDDICDGGATFVKAADALYREEAQNVTLFVTHGIFSKGLKPLKQAGISRIFTAKGEAVTVDSEGAVGYKEIN